MNGIGIISDEKDKDMSNKTLNIFSNFFLKYFFIVYYLYLMCVGVIIPKGTTFGELFNGVLFIFILYMAFVRCLNKRFLFFYLYFLFLVALVLINSSDYMYSLSNLIKYSIQFLCLPIGYSVISSMDKYRELLKTGLICMALYIFNLIVVNLFNLGSTSGYGGTMQIGNLFSDALYLNVYMIVSLFLLLKVFPNKRTIILLLTSICAVLVFVNMKRVVILDLILGFFVFSVLYLRFSKAKVSVVSKYAKYVILSLLLLGVFVYFFSDQIIGNYKIRSEHFENTSEDITNESRAQEMIYVYNEIVNSDDIMVFLFGKEAFNFVGTYAEGKFGERQIHDSYSILLHGTGVLGFFVWLLLHLSVIVWMRRFKNSTPCALDNESSIIYSLFYTYIIIFLISMISGNMSNILSSGFFYTSVGGMLRLFKERKKTICYELSIPTQANNEN